MELCTLAHQSNINTVITAVTSVRQKMQLQSICAPKSCPVSDLGLFSSLGFTISAHQRQNVSVNEWEWIICHYRLQQISKAFHLFLVCFFFKWLRDDPENLSKNGKYELFHIHALSSGVFVFKKKRRKICCKHLLRHFPARMNSSFGWKRGSSVEVLRSESLCLKSQFYPRCPAFMWVIVSQII